MFWGLTCITIGAAGCSSTTVGHHKAADYPDESLVNTYWKLVKVGGAPVTAQENVREAHLVLHRDASRLAGSTGCNTLMGRYQVENPRIAFNQVSTTKLACPAAPMKTERDFLTALKQANTWRVEGARLELLGDNDAPLASFEAVHLY
jgi:heat shock protein HslJ